LKVGGQGNNAASAVLAAHRDPPRRHGIYALNRELKHHLQANRPWPTPCLHLHLKAPCKRYGSYLATGNRNALHCTNEGEGLIRCPLLRALLRPSPVSIPPQMLSARGEISAAVSQLGLPTPSPARHACWTQSPEWPSTGAA